MRKSVRQEKIEANIKASHKSGNLTSTRQRGNINHWGKYLPLLQPPPPPPPSFLCLNKKLRYAAFGVFLMVSSLLKFHIWILHGITIGYLNFAWHSFCLTTAIHEIPSQDWHNDDCQRHLRQIVSTDGFVLQKFWAAFICR